MSISSEAGSTKVSKDGAITVAIDILVAPLLTDALCITLLYLPLLIIYCKTKRVRRRVITESKSLLEKRNKTVYLKMIRYKDQEAVWSGTDIDPLAFVKNLKATNSIDSARGGSRGRYQNVGAFPLQAQAADKEGKDLLSTLANRNLDSFFCPHDWLPIPSSLIFL